MSALETQWSDRLSLSSFKRSCAVFLLVFVAVFPFMHPRGEQQTSRYAATAAIWDLGSFEITKYSELLGRDAAVVDETVYSDKAPGQPILVVPLYGIYRLIGGDPPRLDPAEADLGLWWLTVWTGGVSLAALAVLMYRHAREMNRDTALAATLAMAFGSLLLVYGTLLFAHVLAALFAFGMFLLVRNPYATAVRLSCAGLLGGLAVLVEFPLALIVAVLTAFAFMTHRLNAWPVLLGGSPAVIALGAYNWVLFGSPIMVGYQWSSFSGVREEAGGTLGMFAGPSLERFVDVLFSARGLLIATPVVGVALVGLVFMWRRHSRIQAGVAALGFLSMLAIQMMWSSSYAGGAGPRYATPGLPFLAAPLALAWARWPVVTRGLALISVFTMVLATMTNPQLGSAFDAGLGFWLREALNGELAPTLYTHAFGGLGWLLHAGTVTGAGYLVSQSVEKGDESVL